MDEPTSETRAVTTVETMFELLECIKELDDSRLPVIADEVGLAKSTVHRHLATLSKQGYVIKEGNRYRIGLRSLDLGTHARSNLIGFQEAQRKTRELAEESGELCVYIVEEHGRGYIVCREEGPRAVNTGTRLGKPLYLHATAGGKSILAHYPETEVEQIIHQWGLPEQTSQTITTKSELFEDLEQIQEAGYATNKEEHIDGLYAISAPVTYGDQVIGALCLSGPSNRMTTDRIEDDLVPLLLGATNELELNITHS